MRIQRTLVRRRGPRRRGSAVVEMAIVTPFLALVLLGICELGQALRVNAIMTEAARRGCSTGARPGCSNSDVISEAKSTLTNGNLPADAATITILVNDVAGNVASATRNDKITVRVELPTARTTLTKTRYLIGAAVQSEQATMLKQG